MLNADEEAHCRARPNTIDHAATANLHLVGNYTRRLPVSITRMMENAYDWEHLPFVHRSSFSSIELVDSGAWGWRAKVGLPPGDTSQVIDLLVDEDRHYWATTVFYGRGSGMQIHTQATAVADREIDIDVRFYLAAPSDRDESRLLKSMRNLYGQLYDEDLELMSGRQRALDDRLKWRDGSTSGSPMPIGDVDVIVRDGGATFETPRGRVCVRRLGGRWVAFDAVCPHQGGRLDDSLLDDGIVTCPWHGYRFDVETGENLGGQCGDLSPVGEVIEDDGRLLLIARG